MAHDREFHEYLDRSEEFDADRRIRERVKKATKRQIEQLLEYCPSSVKYDSRGLQRDRDEIREAVIEWIIRGKFYTFVDVEKVWGKSPKIKSLTYPWEIVGNEFSKIAHLASCVPSRNPKSYRHVYSQAEAESLGYRPCKLCKPFRIIPILIVGDSNSRTLHAVNCGCRKHSPKRISDLANALSEGYRPCPTLVDYVRSM